MSEHEHRPSKHRSDEAFERLYRAHRRAVYRFVLRDLGDPQEAEDVTQMAFLDAYRALARGSRPEEPRPWLFTIARNASRRRFRRPQHDEVPLEDTVPIVDPGAAEAAAREIVAAVLTLSERHREVLLLREVHGYSAAEAAGELGTSIAAVEMALFRARREVRHALERAGLGPERRRPIGVLAGLLPAPAAATSLGVVGIGATLVITLAGAGGAPAAHTSPPRVRTPRVEAVVAALRPAAPRRVQSRLDESVGVAADHAPAFEPDAQNEPDSAPTAGTTQQEFQPSAAAAAPAPAPAPASASVQAADPVTPLPAVVDPPVDVPAVKLPALPAAQAPLLPAAGAVTVPAAPAAEP